MENKIEVKKNGTMHIKSLKVMTESHFMMKIDVM